MKIWGHDNLKSKKSKPGLDTIFVVDPSHMHAYLRRAVGGSSRESPPYKTAFPSKNVTRPAMTPFACVMEPLPILNPLLDAPY